MKKLLIHSNNTSFNKEQLFEIHEQFVFDVDFDKDVDFYIDENLAAGDLKSKLEAADIVFIKISLSSNYLEYLGIRLAYHIRLTKSLGEKSKIPIVFIAEESLQFLGQTCQEPSLLSTRGIYLIKEHLESFEKMQKNFDDGLLKSAPDSKELINRIQISPPADYSSHHSIANEWSILQWANVLGIPKEDPLIQELVRRIESLLYYKFLQAGYPALTDSEKESSAIKGKGKILLIDDEWSKGWKVVVSKIFEFSPDLCSNLSTLEYDFKDKSDDEILRTCREEVKAFDPDLVILDLRLADSDFQLNLEPERMMGLKVLREIKRFNLGIRVIIFTASNKVWNLLELQKAGANGFILKGSPEAIIEENGARDTILRFKKTIQDQLEYQFQKHLFRTCEAIKSKLKEVEIVPENDPYNTFISLLLRQIEIIRAAISSINIDQKVTIDIVFLLCYNFLEQFKNHYLRYNQKDHRYYLGIEEELLLSYWVNKSTRKLQKEGEYLIGNRLGREPGWFDTLAGLFIDYFEVSTFSDPQILDLRKIADKRNNHIHGRKNSFNEKELILIFKAMQNACKLIKE